MKLYVCTLVLSILSSISASASCSVAPRSQYECKGRKLITNAQELSAYLENYHFNSNKQTVKGITLSGSFSGESLDIASPCPIHIKAGTSFNFTGDICLSSAKKVIGRDNLTINASNLTMTAPERVILNNNLNATISNQMSLVSTGTSIDSRAHIRHTSTINAGSLSVIALRRATLGHTSTYNITGKITLSSNGEDLPDDAELGNSEWSSIWRDTSITASELSITALERARIGRGVTVTAPKTTISAKSCSFNKTAIFNSAEKLGDCFSGRHPAVKFKYSPKKEAQAGQAVLIDASQSTYLEGSRFFWSFYEGEDSVVRQETTIPSTSHAFTTLGKKKIELKLITPEGFYAIARRNITIIGDNPLLPPTSILSANPSTGEAPLAITLEASASTDSDGSIVKYIFSDGTNFVETTEDRLTLVQETPGTFTYQVEVFDDSGLSSIATTEVVVTPEDTTGESAILPFFKYNLIPNGEFYKVELIYESRTLNGREITNAFYSAGPDTLPVGRRVLGHKDIIDFESPEPVELTINVTDELGGTATFTHTINPIIEQQRPNLQIDSIEFNPNEVVFFSNLIFDPYNQLEGIERYNIDFGDGTSQEIDGPWFQINHQYPNTGLYNATLTAFGRNGASFSHNQEIEVVGSRASYELPIADFRVEQGDAFPGVRLYVDQSISPNAPIKQFLWNLGDDTTAYGSEVIHFYDAGAYDVTLTAILEDGSSSVVKREAIIMRDAPNMIGVVDCFDEGDLKTICDFSALDRFGELSEVKIHFGDSEINDSTINSAPTSGNYQEFAFEHQYQNAGTYRVVYQVLSSRGEVLDGETEVTVSEGNGNQPPIADLACYTSFNSIDCHAFASIDYDGFITNYKFTFGNGDSFETVDPQAFYTYPENGVYEITLEVTDNLGATSSASQVVTIEEKPNEFPVPQLVCDSNNVQELTCNASSSYDSDGSIVGARITFLEDGEAFESSDFLSLNPTKSFSTGGVKSVKLEIEDDQGALVEVVRDFEPKENQAPIASFVCLSDVKNTINCDARSSQDDESITSYEWNIAGSIYYGETLSLSNVETQELEVSLTVKDRFNATESKAKIFQIQQNLPPYGSFVCESTFPFNLICTADFKDSDGSITSYAWLIDGESYIGEAIELNLSSGGLKEILIYVEDDSNAVTTSKRNIFVQDNAPPVAKITVDEEVKLSPAQFNIKATGSYDPDDNAITYKWELPSGEIKTGEEISFNTSEDGEFNIKLTVADPFTTTTINKKVTATSLVNNDIIAEGDRGTIPTNISLEPKELQDPLGNALSFKWYINGDLYSESVNPSLSIENIEDKNVLLITEDIFGNYTSASTVLTFEKPPLYFSLEQDFYTLDANQETRIRLQSLNTTDNQLQVLTSSTLDLVSNHDDGDLTVKGATAGIGLLTIEATSGDRSFTRTVEIEILAPAEPKQLTLTADQLPLSIDGETYAYLSGAEGSQVEVRATKNSQGDVRIYLNGALDSEAVVIKPAQENGYDIKLSNPQISSFTGTEIAAIFGGIYSDTIYLHDDGLAATVKICPYPFGYTVKKFLAATPTIDIQKRTDTTTPSAEYLPTFSIGNQKIQVHRKVVTDYFNISVNNQTQQLRYIPNFEAANMKKLLAIFENDEFDIGAPLRIHAQDIFEPNAAAHVIEGVQAIYINHSWLQELAINSHKLLFILAHERAHLRQNSISCKTIRKMKSLQDYEVVKESMANARAFKVLLEFIDEPYVEKDLLTFNTHRSNVSEKNEGKAGGINEELKSLLNIGINNNITTQADTYTNGYHLDLLEESLTEYIERRIPDDHYSNPLLDELDFLNTYHPQSLPASFKDKAVGYLDYLFENKALLKLGFDEAKASHSIEEAESNDLTVGPYGFGVVRIPSSVIKQNSVNDQEFRIEIAGTAFQNLELSTTGNSYNEFESIKQIEIEGDNRIILSIKIQQSNKDGYLFLTNSHEESHTGALVKDYTGICLDNELPFNNKCVICLERYGGAIDTSSGECRYPGPIESKWTGRNVSDHKEACNKWYAGETGGQSPGLQKVTKTFSYLCAGDDAIEKHIQVAYGEYTCRYQFYSDGTYEFVNKYSAYEDTQTSVTANCHQSQTIFEVPSVL